MNKIGILTSGGDAPGMNAAIRAIVRYGLFCGKEMIGIERGYAGLMDKLFRKMEMRSVSDIIQRGGTILRTARCLEFITPEGQQQALRNIREEGIEGMIVIGGDGSMMGAKVLSEMGIPTIGIPGTIDNDLGYTEYTLGFDTAVNTCLEVINKLRDTMASHERISVVEVMGRNCGDIALYAGIGGGAEVIIVPEHKISTDAIIQRLTKSRESGKTSGIIVLSEGAGRAADLKKDLMSKSSFEIRTTVIGHMQRGGAPSSQDRILGTKMGAHAVKLLDEGKSNRIIGINENKIFDMDISEGLKVPFKFDMELYNTASIVSR